MRPSIHVVAAAIVALMLPPWYVAVAQETSQQIQLEDLAKYAPWGGANQNLKEALWALDAYLKIHPLCEETKNQPDALATYGPVYLIRGWEALEGSNWPELYELSTEFLEMFPQDTSVYSEAISYWRMCATEYVDDKRGERPAATEAAANKFTNGAPIPQSLAGLLARNISAALVETKSAEEGGKFLRELPLHQPRVLSDKRYWEALITLAGMGPDARQTAMVHFRLCPYNAESVGSAMSGLLQTLGPGASQEELASFAKYLETGEGKNPLADVGMPEVTDEQLAAMLSRMWSPEEQLMVYLYASRFQKTMGLAVQMVFAGQAGLEEIARCFKAEDGHLGRANRYIEFMKTGQGENPLKGYPVAY